MKSKLLCNSKCLFLEKWGAEGFTDDINNGLQQRQLHTNFNCAELKRPQFEVRAINMDLKIIPHVNGTHRPKEFRQATHILRRVFNFSRKKKINSPHGYIQLSITSNRSSTPRHTKPRSEHPAVLSCPRPVPPKPALASEAAARGSPLQSCSPSFSASLYHRPIFVAFFFSLYWFISTLWNA